jgi:hypothetical protein
MTRTDTNPAPPAADRPSLRLDFDTWLPMLADETIDEAQKRAFVETLWHIVIAFVDLGVQMGASGTPHDEDFDLLAALAAAATADSTGPS